MKKMFSRFMKDTRGVVMMEYIVLGLFAVAVTVVAVMTLGATYNDGLITMSYATAGETSSAGAAVEATKAIPSSGVTKANEYVGNFDDTGTSAITFITYRPVSN